MEYLILFLALLGVGMLVFASGLWESKKQERWQREKLAQSFGKPSDRKYADGEFHGIPRYFERHREGFFLDDITWNDLDMDGLFTRMNTTESSAGQEYLYAMLRCPSFSQEELEGREAVMQYFARHGQERLKVQLLYRQMGRTGKYSLYDYLDFLEDLGERKNGREIFFDLLFIPVLALFWVNAQVGLMALLLLLIHNITVYLKEKGKIEPYLTSFQYIFRTLGTAQKLGREKIPVLEKEQKELGGLLLRFQKLKRNSVLGMRRLGGSGNLLDLFMDYWNMVFHFDILAFNRMLLQVRRHTADMDALLTIMGRVDALIAAAGYREGLQAYCIPEFAQGGQAGLAVLGLYHPMLENPVKNDIITQKGVLLTGSNASGKSTFLKAVALNAVLAQTIHACCADSYKGLFFRIMTSMALRDDLIGGESYYIVEIKSLKRILDSLADTQTPVLCFVDEVLRGTNTVERIAASTQILRSLHRPGICCFAATHDIELTQLLREEYENYHFEEEITEGDIHFPYRLQEGKATTRNAIRLLAIMGYGEELIADAEKMAAHFVESGQWEKGERVCLR